MCLTSINLFFLHWLLLKLCLYQFTPVRMAIFTKSANSKCWRGCGEKGTLVHCWWDCRLVQPLWKTVWNFLRKLKMDLPFDPAIPLLGLYPKNPETPIQKNLSTLMFIAAQFIIAKCWKQPRCPSVNAWIKKLWCITQWSSMQQKEGAPTLCDSMDGTGEHYAIHYSIHALKRVYCIMNDIFRAYINK